jgi:uncharacterized protein YbbC (DUF1343 family)
MPTPKVQTGLTRLLAGAVPALGGASLGLILHPASVTASLTWAADALLSSGFRVTALFGAQHGARGEKQDDMIESAPYTDARTGLPVHSLYGDVRKPTSEMLAGLDAVLFDMQDVGVRIYTFVWTMTLALEACAEAGVRFVVLDRPNPIGGLLREGPIRQPEYTSFVGLHPIPLRHGLTAGELARIANEEFGIGAELEVVACENWRRADWFDATGLPYVLPSPNLPTLDSCTVFPGMVLLEGTNLSEGRGTTRPFEIFGAPFLDPHELVGVLDEHNLPGVTFRPCHFEPTFHKHGGLLCGGAQLHVIDRDAFRPVETAVAILCSVQRVARADFAWRGPPYEYETEKMPIDVLWGSDSLRRGIDAGATVGEILDGVDEEIREFEKMLEPYLLYE